MPFTWRSHWSFMSLSLGMLLLCGCQAGEAPVSEVAAPRHDIRIISLSGFLTELLFDLEYGDQLVARDVTSVFPEQVKSLPNLGHITQLNAEALLQLAPDLVLLEATQAQESPVLDQIRRSGIKVVAVPTSYELQNAVHAARYLQQELTIPDHKISSLRERITQDSLALQQTLAGFDHQPSVLFLYARGAGRLLVGGTETAASAMIERAGGRNAIQSFADFQALSPEYLLQAAPEVILMFTSGYASLDGKAGLAQIPGMIQTPAFQHDRVVTMDGHYLTAFSARAALAAADLAKAIHQP